MAITTRDGLIAAMGAGTLNNFGYISFTTVAGQKVSPWYIQSLKGRNILPTTAQTCTPSTRCALRLPSVTTQTIYVSKLQAVSTSACTIYLYDRLAHMGGLSGTSTSAQTANVTLTTAASQSRCQSNGSDVQWYLQWYADTGGTAVTATITYTNQSGTTGRTTTVSLAATRKITYLQPIYPNTNDKSIQSIQSVTLSATTGTVGNFGVTATKPITSLPIPIANISNVYDYSNLGLPQVSSNACLAFFFLAGTTTSGVMYGTIDLIKG